MSCVAIYCRQSKEDPKSTSVSIPEQIERGKALARKEYPKLKIKIYKDEGCSGQLPPRQWAKPGQKKFREAFTELISDIEKKEVSVLICRRIDRLARNMYIQQRFFEFLPKENFEIRFLDEPGLKHITAEGKLQIDILSAIAEFERKKIESNIRAAKKYSKDHGKKMSSAHWVVGYSDGAKKGHVDIDEKGKNAVIKIFDWFVKGQNYAEITRRLSNDFRGINPPNKSNKWYQSTVKRILQNPAYIGMAYNSDGVLISSQAYKAFIDKKTWNDASKRIRTTSKLNRRTHHGINLLADVIKCGCCGNSLILYNRYSRQKISLGREYKCINQDCKNKAATLGEKIYLDFIFSLFFWDLKETEDNSVKKDIEALETDLAGARASTEKIAKRIKDTTNIEDSWLDILEAREVKVREIEKRLTELRSKKTYKIFPGIRHPEDSTDSELREKICHIFKSIRTHSDCVEVELNNPEECNGYLTEMIRRAAKSPTALELKALYYPKAFRMPIMLTARPSKKCTLCIVPKRFEEKHLFRLKFCKRYGVSFADWTSMAHFFPLVFNQFYFKDAALNTKYISQKKCCRCQKVLPIIAPSTSIATFSKNKLNKDGWHSYCKSCVRLQKEEEPASSQQVH